MLAVHLTVAAIVILSQLLLLPPVLASYQVLWILWLQGPLVAGTFMATPVTKDTLTQMPRTDPARQRH